MCKCDCGGEARCTGIDLRKGHTKSCGCLQRERTSEASRLNLTGQRFGKLVALEPTEKTKWGSILWHCKCDCGNDYYVVTRDLNSGHTTSCGCRSISKGEEKILNILLENNILFTKEQWFDDLLYEDTGRKARFDFYIEEGYVIEYDGLQHFKSGTGFYDNPEKFETIQYHDRVKNEYCWEHNIPIIRIPYTRYDNLCLEDLKLETSQFILKP